MTPPFASLRAIVFPSGQSQTHHNRASIHCEYRAFARIGHKQKRRNGDEGQELGQRIPNWNGPKNKDHGQPIDAKNDPIIVAQHSVSHTSGAAPAVNGNLSNIGDNQRIHGPENQGGDDGSWS